MVTPPPFSLTPSTIGVLKALLSAPERESHGWALVKTPGLGDLLAYRTLRQCEEAELVSTRWEDSPNKRPRRRVYKLTQDGAERAQQIVEEYERRLPRRILSLPWQSPRKGTR